MVDVQCSDTETNIGAISVGSSNDSGQQITQHLRCPKNMATVGGKKNYFSLQFSDTASTELDMKNMVARHHKHADTLHKDC
jgi:hypothetical protein